MNEGDSTPSSSEMSQLLDTSKTDIFSFTAVDPKALNKSVGAIPNL